MLEQGHAALAGIAFGAEVLCRLSLVAPKAVHRAGFHPTAVFGVLGATAGAGLALRLTREQMTHALGIAGSMAGGIIEYLADGSWTKRLHPGWAAQSGIRAALLARAGFVGPRSVFEGTHGLFNGFARTRDGDFAALTQDLGRRWVVETLAFKPYPCGTMTHPYIDCARRLAAHGIEAGDVAEFVCEVAEGTVHRLWEPLAEKRRPPNAYAAKFSTPWCIAAGFLRDGVGLDAFTDERVSDPAVLDLAGRVRYVVDPKNPYPAEFTGHIRAVLRNGTVVEERQAHLRGGAHEPLAAEDIESKFLHNVRHGGWPAARAEEALRLARTMFDRPIDLSPLRG
jgi:2-methylcitrate dehydratase PrpD